LGCSSFLDSGDDQLTPAKTNRQQTLATAKRQQPPTVAKRQQQTVQPRIAL